MDIQIILLIIIGIVVFFLVIYTLHNIFFGPHRKLSALTRVSSNLVKLVNKAKLPMKVTIDSLLNTTVLNNKPVIPTSHRRGAVVAGMNGAPKINLVNNKSVNPISNSFVSRVTEAMRRGTPK